MRKPIYFAMISLDGYIARPDGSLDWVIADEQLHRFINDRQAALGGYVYGRRMYELMAAAWPPLDEDPTAPDYIADFARLWQAKPKIVFSQSLQHVEWNARLAVAMRQPRWRGSRASRARIWRSAGLLLPERSCNMGWWTNTSSSSNQRCWAAASGPSQFENTRPTWRCRRLAPSGPVSSTCGTRAIASTCHALWLRTERKSMSKCLRTVLWRNDADQMYEYCALGDTGEGVRLAGAVVTAVDTKPLRIVYEIACDSRGLTQAVKVDLVGGLGERRIQLVANGQRAWRWNGAELPECQGCAEVDLRFSPSTNALPIRRLKLAIGEGQTFAVAWLRYPELDVIAFPQRYTRLDSQRYLFESLLSDFRAELAVDEHGMVQRYGELWEAVATGREC